MEPSGQKLLARCLLLLLAALGGLWLVRLDYSEKLSTNVMDLVPASERDPEVAVLRSLADERQARVLLFALSGGNSAKPGEGAERFARHLRGAAAFDEVVVLGGTAGAEALGRFVVERRMELLLPSWLERAEREADQASVPAIERADWLAARVVETLDRFLLSPEAAAFEQLVPLDPLLLVPTLLTEARGLLPPEGASRHGLVWARIAASPLSEEGQQPVFTVIADALEKARAVEPGLELQWTGVNRFAASSKERIRAEMEWLNALSLAGVLLVALLLIQRVWKVLHLAPVILLSLLGGWVAVTLAFERVHVLVFVLGALLAGVAVDYGFYLYLQPALRAGERYREKLARLAKPLLTSCLTTVAGFLFLLLSELPLIRQLGVFVSAGLVSALAGAVLWFAQLDHPYLAARSFAAPRVRSVVGKWIRWSVAGILVVCAIGVWRLEWRDNVRELEVPNVELRENDQAVRALFGDRPGRTVYLTRGGSVDEARGRLEAFETWHAAEFPGAGVSTIGRMLPSTRLLEELPRRLGELAGFERALRERLAAGGYDAEAFEPFFKAWQERAQASSAPALGELSAALQKHLSGPLGMLHFQSAGSSWFVSIGDHVPGANPPENLGTVAANQLETLNTLFARYRHSALVLSGAGLACIGASVFLLYGLRLGLRIFAIPAGSCLAVFGVLGLLGQSLNLFHLLGAFLGVCLSHNYAIFSAENAGRGEPPPPSIRLSALTTAVSFGVLGTSRIPVVSALGLTVAAIVLTALLVVELENLSHAPKEVAS